MFDMIAKGFDNLQVFAGNIMDYGVSVYAAVLSPVIALTPFAEPLPEPVFEKVSDTVEVREVEVDVDVDDYDCSDILFQVGDKEGQIKREFITTVDGTRVYNIHGVWVPNDKDNPFCI